MVPSQRGLLISFDGVDSSGKATQTRQLAERLRWQGLQVQTFATPDYSTPSGQELKLRLQGKLGNWHATSWTDKMKYFAANRAEHKDEVLAALQAGEVVIYDRYVPSSLAFVTIEALEPQMVDLYRQKMHAAIKKEEYQHRGMPEEDVSIFLDVPPSVSAELLERRREKLRDEAEYTDHLAVQERLYNEYDVMTKADPTHFLRVSCVNGNQLLSIDDCAEIIWEGLRERFPWLGLPYGQK